MHISEWVEVIIVRLIRILVSHIVRRIQKFPNKIVMTKLTMLFTHTQADSSKKQLQMDRHYWIYLLFNTKWTCKDSSMLARICICLYFCTFVCGNEQPAIFMCVCAAIYSKKNPLFVRISTFRICFAHTHFFPNHTIHWHFQFAQNVAIWFQMHFYLKLNITVGHRWMKRKNSNVIKLYMIYEFSLSLCQFNLTDFTYVCMCASCRWLQTNNIQFDSTKLNWVCSL